MNQINKKYYSNSKHYVEKDWTTKQSAMHSANCALCGWKDEREECEMEKKLPCICGEGDKIKRKPSPMPLQ